ncbi:unnamed protein product [Brassica oleracea]|uniref:(rape) hypothetical protein n=1 Tax=Brassica napus TaxID=3708 RepID=A0A816LN35_BRANA|nr:unnamed protein product [Brassica napus]
MLGCSLRRGRCSVKINISCLQYQRESTTIFVFFNLHSLVNSNASIPILHFLVSALSMPLLSHSVVKI